ncbi:hypothetical protein GWK47_012205 [Chionoecetes opilio]|uniref:Uncharacterized protein n=1 Tax=Chionoecetes opilio TaxID=41210 RepID=A0A8J5C261_CHIOP|nr:hypothetical protein GWK47_012205 [Chionoecetes opilio]
MLPGLQTKIGDIAHSFIIPHNPDNLATVETFLNPTIPANFGHIQVYSRLDRRDRAHGTFGGIAVCFREGLAVEALEVEMDRHLEMMFYRLCTSRHDTTLLCVCYRPQWQGNDPIHFLHTNIDTLLFQHSCNHLIVVGNMNQHMVARQLEDLLTEYGLSYHVNFPTHTSVSSLGPVARRSDHLPPPWHGWIIGPLCRAHHHQHHCGTRRGYCPSQLALYRRAADKSRAWLRYKSHPSQLNKHRHKEACKTMCQVQKQAIQRWREELKAKYSGQQEQVTVPFSRTDHHLRSFLPRYGRLWNQLVHQTDLHHHASLQEFKRGVNSWLIA